MPPQRTANLYRWEVSKGSFINLSKLIITSFLYKDIPCTVSALQEEGKINELRIRRQGTDSILGNVYVAKVETISKNINAAFLLLGGGQRAYFPLEEAKHLLYASGYEKKDRNVEITAKQAASALLPGDEVLVQVTREAMKGKLPAVTANISLTGKYLVLTTANQKVGISTKLSIEDRKKLSGWFADKIQDTTRDYGLILRTNAAMAERRELFSELEYLRALYDKVIRHGRNRTCFSILYRPPAFYLEMLRDQRMEKLEEIITDQEEIFTEIQEFLTRTGTLQTTLLRHYQDKLLPLYKLFSLETVIDEITSEKVWLKSGGFLIIQQTEAFVVIDVNSGKNIQGKIKEETIRKLNLEAAPEIARQLRLRNLSGIILIDFINLENPEHQEELFHVLKKILKQDPVKCTVVDITPLHILEMTRKKTRRPVIEDLREIECQHRV